MLFIRSNKISPYIFVSLLVSFSLILLLVAPTATAQPAIKGLGLSPLRSELEITPGTSLAGTLTVTNATNAVMKVDLSAEEFSVIGQQYDYTFNSGSELAKWIRFSIPSLNLAAESNQVVKYTINAPINAEPGGRYISLFASTNAGEEDVAINAQQRVASLIYLTVAGDVSRKGELLSLSSPFIATKPADWTMVLRNSGTTHFRSRYSVSMNNILDGTTAATAEGDALIMPGTVRLVADKTPLPKWPGIYKIVYNIGLGDTPAVNRSNYILYLPIDFIFTILAFGVVVTGLWRYQVSRRRRH